VPAGHDRAARSAANLWRRPISGAPRQAGQRHAGCLRPSWFARTRSKKVHGVRRPATCGTPVRAPSATTGPRPSQPSNVPSARRQGTSPFEPREHAGAQPLAPERVAPPIAMARQVPSGSCSLRRPRRMMSWMLPTAGDAGAEVDELPDSGVEGRAHHPPQERTVVLIRLDRRRANNPGNLPGHTF
jgi:hypothetical protein